MSDISKITSYNTSIQRKQVDKKIVENEGNNQFQQQLESLDNEMEVNLGQNAKTTLGAKQKAKNMNKYLSNLVNMIEKISPQGDSKSTSAISSKVKPTQYQNTQKEV